MRVRSLVVGSAVAAVVAGALGYGVASGRLSGSPTHEIRVSFPTGDGLVAGSDVFAAGAKVGSIESIEPQAVDDPGFRPAPDGGGSGASGDRAVVTLGIEDSHWPLHDGLTAGIRPKSLLGEKYVDLHDAGTAVFDTSKVIVAPADSTPVELDQFINSLDPSARASAKVLLDDLGAGIAGRGVDLNQAIQSGRDDLAHLAVTGQTLNNRDADLDRIIVGLDGVLQKLTQDGQLTQLSQLIDNGQKTLNAIEAERASFSRGFVDAQLALSDLNAALDPAIQALRQTITALPHLLSVLGPESTLLAQLGSDMTMGDRLQVFQSALAGGGLVSGGALERANGAALPIFRVCLQDPTQTGPQPQNSCQGHGFNPPPGSITQPVPQTASAPGDNGYGSSLATLAAFVGA